MTGVGAAGDTWTWADVRLWLVYEIRRLDCPDCGVRTEELPWARPGARHTRDFEDMVLWLAQRTDRTSVATLMRCAWETVTAIINRGVAELLDARRLNTLYRIGVDEICYRHPHRYLTIIGDHDTGTVVDIQPGRSEDSLANFYASQPDSTIGPDRSGQHGCVPRPTPPPPAPMCQHASHLLRPVPHHAMGQPRPGPRCIAEAATGPGQGRHDLRADGAPPAGRCAPGRTNSPTTKRALVNQIARTNRRIGRAWTLKEQAARPLPRRPPTRRSPANYLRPGSPPPNAAASTPSSPWPNASRSTSTHHRRHRTRHLQRPHRRHQRQNPPHQRPRLRTPLRPNADLNDLPLPRRTAGHATHKNLRSRTLVRGTDNLCRNVTKGAKVTQVNSVPKVAVAEQSWPAR